MILRSPETNALLFDESDRSFERSSFQTGLPPAPAQIPIFSLAFQRRSLAASAIGGIRETQEMLDYCAEKNITADVEVIKPDRIEEAYDRTIKSDVRYRFVIDMREDR